MKSRDENVNLQSKLTKLYKTREKEKKTLFYRKTWNSSIHKSQSLPTKLAMTKHQHQ